MRQSPSSYRLKILSASLMLFAVQTSYAQLEEVVVTATKRIETLQEVPVSVSVMSAETMAQAGITDLAEISAYIPNFEASDASILPNLYVRGIGSGTTHSIEQSVGRFVDEVYIGRAAINLHGFMDVSSVEVLRGPQGTLFGKNTLGGAIIMHSADPTDELEIGLDATVSDYSTVGGRTELSGFVSGPLSDSVRGRVAFQWKDEDGYVENRLPGPDGGTREDYGIRVKFDWDAGENTLVKLKLEHQEYEGEGQIPAELVGGTFPGGPFAGQPMTEAFFRQFSPNFSFDRDWKIDIDCTASIGPKNETFCPGREQDSQNVTLKIDHDISGKGTITSVSSYQAYDYNHRFVAVDVGLFGGANRPTRPESYSGFSQELRLTSEEFERYDYIVGLYYEKSDLERLQPNDFNIAEFLGAPPPPSGISFGPPYFSERQDWQQDTETLAVFGQVRWNVTEKVTAILGGRWSTEDKDFHFETAIVPLQDDPNLATDTLIEGSRSENKFTPSLTIRYELSDDHMFYATVAQGHKTGGFSDRVQTPPTDYDAELNTSFELGLKSLLLGGSVEINLALFHMSIEDLQVARTIPGQVATFELRNAAEATSQGIEFDGRWLINDSWTLGGSFAYTDATFDDFPGASSSCPTIGGTLEQGVCNYDGLPLVFAPEYKGSIYLNYSVDDFIAGWGLNSRIIGNYSDEFYPEINYIKSVKQDEYSTWDASVRLSSPDERWTVALIGRNLTEEHVIAFGLEAGFTQFIAPKSPREFALQVSYRY